MEVLLVFTRVLVAFSDLVGSTVSFFEPVFSGFNTFSCGLYWFGALLFFDVFGVAYGFFIFCFLESCFTPKKSY